ncbi:MAG: imidazole glycerol phosphate synthase subunit HisH [Gaiellales bacterium]
MSGTVTVIDYEAGNLASLTAAFRRLERPVEVTGDAARVARARLLVLPGVGAAGPAIRELRRLGIDQAVSQALAAGATLFGICLGMQLLFDRSDEGGEPCLGLLPGASRRIGWSRRLPHMGWNDVSPRSDHPLSDGLPAVCYFAHSYAVEPDDADMVVAETELDGRSFPCVVARGAVAGAQFHPERSGGQGRRLLTSYLAWADAA